MPQRIGKRSAGRNFNALNLGAVTLYWSLNIRALIEARRCADYMRKLRELLRKLFPILNSRSLFFLENRDVRRRAKKIALQRIFESIVDGKRNDQRHHPRRYPSHRNKRDDRNDDLFTLSAQIAAGDKKFKHEK